VAETSEQQPPEHMRNVAMTLIGQTSKTIEAKPAEEMKVDAPQVTLSLPEKTTA